MKMKSLMLASGATMAGVLTFSAPALAAPPEPFTFELRIEEGARFGSCAFDVLVQATGKAKTITTPTGKVIGVSANTTATATSLDPESDKSVQYSVNGTFTNTTDSDGNVTTKATGRNLLTDPDAGVVVTSGNFTFTFDENGNLVEGLSGTGEITDVCAALS
jgi:hypothetical protein